MIMAKIFMQGGLLMWPLVFIVLILFGIVVRATWHIVVRGGSDAAAVQNCLDGLLFWGGFAVIVGVLGSAIGYHRGVSAVVERGLVNPRALWIGTAEGMVTSIAGLVVLAFAGVCWYGLRWRALQTRHGVR